MDEGDSSSDDDYVPSSEGEDVEHDDSEPEASDTKHPDDVGEHNDDLEDTAAPSSSTGRHKSCEPTVSKVSSSGDAGSKEMESEEERKRRIDALFDDFISGSSSSQQQPTSSAVTTDDKDRIDNSIAKPDSVEPTSATDNQLSNQTVTSDVSKDVPSTEESNSCTTEIFEFAGEEVRVEKVKTNDEGKALSTAATTDKTNRTTAPKRTFGGGGGLGDAVKLLGKKPKMSIFDKTKHDWTSFKTETGISDELQSHNRGREGYVERMAFLERADVRQFERERDARNAARAKKS